MSMVENDNLIYTFPEQFSKECLLKKLKSHGMDEVFLEQIKGNVHKLVRCFYENVASLPRRSARDNRRGRLMQANHAKEDKSSLKFPIANSQSSSSCVQCKTSVSKYQTSNQCSLKRTLPASTPEMDKLEARSRATNAKQSQLKTVDHINNDIKAKKIKISSINTLDKSQNNSEKKSMSLNSTSVALVTSTKNADSQSNVQAKNAVLCKKNIPLDHPEMEKDVKPRKKLKRDVHLAV